MRRPLVSIVLPTYNGARYLDDAISSCLNQSYRNIELIIVDDCSTDSTPDIIRSRAAQDGRIRVVTHETNKKLPAALNSGFAQARGEYLSWTSDDNLYQPNAIECMVNAFCSLPGVSILYADYSVISDTGQVIGTVSVREPEELVLGSVVGPCFMYKRAVHDIIGQYDEALFLVEDYDFWLRAAQRFQFASLHTDLYRYRQHQQSLSASRCIEFSSAYCKAVSKSLHYFESSEDELKGRVYFKHGVHLFTSGQIAEARESLRTSVEELKTLESWPIFALNQMIYTHGGELRDESSLIKLLHLIPGLNRWTRAKFVSWLHVVACFKAYRERNPAQVRAHFVRAVRHNWECLGNRGLLKIFAQACLDRTGRWGIGAS